MTPLDQLRSFGAAVDLTDQDELRIQAISLEDSDWDRVLAFARIHKMEIVKALLHDTWTCRACGEHAYWLNLGGCRICAACHPPARPDVFEIIKPWR